MDQTGGIAVNFGEFLRRGTGFLPRYIRRRGAGLSCALLISALMMAVWADSAPGHVHILWFWARYTVDMAAIVLGAGLIGSLLLEDIQTS